MYTRAKLDGLRRIIHTEIYTEGGHEVEREWGRILEDLEGGKGEVEMMEIWDSGMKFSK